MHNAQILLKTCFTYFCLTSYLPLHSLIMILYFLPSISAGPGPTQEELRRKVENGVKEFWYFVRSEVKKLSNVENSERQKYADTLLQDLGHQERWANAAACELAKLKFLCSFLFFLFFLLILLPNPHIGHLSNKQYKVYITEIGWFVALLS